MIKFVIHSVETPWGHVWHILTNDGYGVCNLEYDEDNDDELFIYGLSVYESARRKGYGTSLINQCERMARKEGYNKISLEVDKTNKNFQRWYERLGYSKISEDEYNFKMTKTL